jgi:hypothetical protein
VAAICALVVAPGSVPGLPRQIMVTDEALAIHDFEEFGIGMICPLATGVVLVAIPSYGHAFLFLPAA